ncbi:hypothetical protein [Flavobacterium sp. LC2016-01]|uniref:YobI family P-loop NTPase n=1 Tax=Flavobacterium sp. LC2016-01 TaxID=2675876 RepID=UPI0012BB1144|nr:hypothetical protein [Flavobacterium sp. LC2016-01]MTH17752.1 hypothetical protein [Flavobacterium sp. LC2016-01]
MSKSKNEDSKESNSQEPNTKKTSNSIVYTIFKDKPIIIFRKFAFWYKRNYLQNKFSNEDNLKDFSPVILDDNEDKYSDIMKFSVDNPKVKNVALTGSYGSGKSSIISTFENKFSELECLNISLATFDGKQLKDIKAIELCILKQLFYSVEHDTIPESRFKRIVNQKWVKTKTFLFALWLISLLYVSGNKLLCEIFYSQNYQEYIKLIYLIIFSLGSFCVLYILMNFVLNFKISKIKFSEVDVDNNQDKKTISFENEIDEILYFFERKKIEVVFFEDLDRYKETLIFIKLREINQLINNYEPIKKRGKVTFIYAVNDDIFKEDERTKFFDFIIPVIPIINYTNSSKTLIDNISGVDKTFLEEVSRYLTDKRLLNSIINEYTVYKKVLGEELAGEKLLAIIVYKNVEPADFENLNNRKGFVYNLFRNVSTLFAEKIKLLEEEITNYEKIKDDSQKETLSNIYELKALYIFKFFDLVDKKGLSNKGMPYFDERLSVAKLGSDEKFEIFKESKNITLIGEYSIKTETGISFKDIETSFENKKSYDERLKFILNKEKSNSSQLNQNIERRKAEIASYSSKRLKDLITLSYYDNCLNFDCIDGIFKIEKKKTHVINNYDLVKYLVNEGYIDEDYEIYISRKDGNVSKVDTDFLLSFTNNRPLAFDYKLDDIKALLSQNKIKEANFSKDSIMNFSLLDYVIEKGKDQKSLLIINHICNRSAQFVKFMDGYVHYGSSNNVNYFFKKVCNLKDDLIDIIFVKGNFTEEKRMSYVRLFFINFASEEIVKMDSNNVLTNYISEFDDLNVFHDPLISIVKVKDFIISKNVKFSSLKTAENEFTPFVYQSNYYLINENMIRFFIMAYCSDMKFSDSLDRPNYTAILESGCSPLINYINDNISTYYNNVYSKLEENNNESETALLKLLNEESLIDFREEILRKNKHVINDINEIQDKEFWNILIKERKLAISWDNILAYFVKCENIIDEDLFDFLNNSVNYLQLINDDFDLKGDARAYPFFVKFANSRIKLEAFQFLIICFLSIEIKLKDFGSVPTDKMELLIDFKFVEMDKHSFDFINNGYNELLLKFIKENKEKFIEILNELSLDKETIYKIIRSSDFDDILATFIILMGKPYSEIYDQHIVEIENNPFNTEFAQLLKSKKVIRNFNTEDNLIFLKIKGK